MPPDDLQRTLPRAAYQSEATFAAESELIFAREWVLAARAESLPSPGDYLHLTIAGESLLLVRGADDRLRAFHNLCRHRGCELVLTSPGAPPTAASGRPDGTLGRAIRCPYHSWTYSLEGDLRAAPHLEDQVADCRDQFSLYQAGVAEWGGFVFIHLDPVNAAARGHTLAAQIGPAQSRIRNYPLADLRIARRVVYEVAANWKVILENYNECYHCAFVHPELCRVVPAFRQNGGAGLDWEHGVPHRDGAVTFTFSGTTTRAAFPGLDEQEQVRHKGELIYPNMMISLSMDHVAVFTLVPRSPDQTTVITDFLFHPTEIAKPDFDPADAVDFWDLTNRQDWAICEAVQRGMRSRRFEHGYYAPMESASLDIRDYVGARLGPRFDGAP
ncbi:MAG: aromatic ring-hydroxylating oxygenase subunit alpha [Gemmatimonadales bacterium]